MTTKEILDLIADVIRLLFQAVALVIAYRNSRKK